MQLRRGNMWSAWNEADLFLITTNSIIKKNGALVMGAGIARQARDRFPGLDLALGGYIHLKRGGTRVLYGLIVSPKWPHARLGAFQTKIDWRDDSDPEVIKFSVECLLEWLEHFPDAKVHLAFPGINHGNLSVEQVLPIISALPDNVTVWHERSLT
jgi:hypothetical protein